MALKLILFAFISLPFAAFAQENKLIELFNDTFYSDSIYESSKCNLNVRRYLKLARNQGIDISGIEVIQLINKGFDNFGLVGAKNARGGGEKDHHRNWHHHVFLKLNDTILDFDYTLKPSPTKVSVYFKSMYLSEAAKKNKIRCEKDTEKYQITIFSGKDYLRYYDERISLDLIDKKIFSLKDSPWACQ